MILHPRTSQGFTLVELLVAMIVASFIVGAALSAYLAAMNAWEKSRSRADGYQHARVALNLMERTLRSAVAPDSATSVVFSGSDNYITGTELGADVLRFTTTGMAVSHDCAGSADVAEVEFYLDLDEELGEPRLMFRRRAFAGQDEELFPPVEDELAPNIVSFDVTYWNGTEFIESWEEESLPRAVNINLTLFDFHADENLLAFQRTVFLPVSEP